MTTWLPMSYRGYWDVPRIMLVRRDGLLFLFDCQFDPELDEYPDDYSVYLMPPDFEEALAPEDWTVLRNLAAFELGAVPVAIVRFDMKSRPAQIDASAFAVLPPVPTPASV